MLKALSYCLKIIRRTLVVTFGVVISATANIADRSGLMYWPFFSEAMGMVPFTFGWQLRLDVYRRLGVCKGADVVLNHGTTIGERGSTIGSDVWMSRDVYVEFAHIGDHVLIGPGAVLLAGRYHHRADSVEVPIKQQGNNPLVPLNIAEGAWIGANATVMADVGRHAIVGAGAVVLKPVPDYAVVAGNPARFIRDRREQVSGEATSEMKSDIREKDALLMKAK
ncbi:MAG TPA: acyltransferase [Pyrinomonadaceae bacterium]|nr:acyltransferase [Pyrinomonadaceae bacterium]